ncbi:MAG: hypothetical protein RI957_884 [Verrucomicrobiota bacterium]
MLILHPRISWKACGSMVSPILTFSSGAYEWEILDAQRYDMSYQLYQEHAERMRIESFYLRGVLDIDTETSFRFQYLRDAISGSSPTGALPGGLQPFLANIEDVRYGILGAISRQFGDHRVELEVSRSEEEDYLSYGYAISDTWELNQKNTLIRYGLNFLDDDVRVIGIHDQKKKNYDLFLGLTQLVDKNTTVSANLTLGYSDGYLNDQYKAIQRTDTLILPDDTRIPVVNMYAENRPATRLREVLQIQATHYVESVRGAIDTVFRFSHDDYGVLSQTLQLEWRQAVGDSWQITPFIRYYHQNAADFFTNSLDDIPVENPSDYPDGSGPNYSSDYRLSSFEAISGGLKVRYQFNDYSAATFAYENYQMNGLGNLVAPSASYIRADIWTMGILLTF